MPRHGNWLIVAIPIILLGWWIVWTKPACRDGYIAQWSPFGSGWNCVAGYKP